MLEFIYVKGRKHCFKEKARTMKCANIRCGLGLQKINTADNGLI